MLEKLRGTFDKGVAAVSVKSETLVESSRTKTAISSAQRRMDSELDALGRNIYLTWKNGQFSLEQFQADFERVLSIEQEVATLTAHLEEIKQEELRILGTPTKSAGCFCSNCGKALPAGSRFCDECGTPVKG